MLGSLIISSSKHHLDRLVGLREAEGTGDLGWSKLRWSRGLVGAHGKVGNFCFVVCVQRDIKGSFSVRRNIYAISLRKSTPPGPRGGVLTACKENDRL